MTIGARKFAYAQEEAAKEQGSAGNLARNGSEEGDEIERIGAGAVYGSAPMKVRAGNATGGADLAEDGARIDEFAGLDGDGFKMSVEGIEAEPVIEDHGVTGEIKRLG